MFREKSEAVRYTGVNSQRKNRNAFLGQLMKWEGFLCLANVLIVWTLLPCASKAGTGGCKNWPRMVCVHSNSFNITFLFMLTAAALMCLIFRSWKIKVRNKKEKVFFSTEFSTIKEQILKSKGMFRENGKNGKDSLGFQYILEINFVKKMKMQCLDLGGIKS